MQYASPPPPLPLPLPPPLPLPLVLRLRLRLPRPLRLPLLPRLSRAGGPHGIVAEDEPAKRAAARRRQHHAEKVLAHLSLRRCIVAFPLFPSSLPSHMRCCLTDKRRSLSLDVSRLVGLDAFAASVSMRSDRRDGFGIGIEFVESAFPGIVFDRRGDGSFMRCWIEPVDPGAPTAPTAGRQALRVCR